MPLSPEVIEINTIKADLSQFKGVMESIQKESNSLKAEINLLWICIAAFLVFFMQAGFALVEAGFTRAKNTVNILMKNLSDFTIGSICFWLIGFSLMFGPHLLEGIGIGKISFLETSLLLEDGKPSPFKYGFFLFQLVFAATATTIVSGAMAERTKFTAYLIYSFLMTALIYPIFGSFAWSNLFDTNNPGFLAKMGFVDFAGSTVVHSIGGWAGLAGTMVLKPRLGRYQPGGVIIPILGHNMTIAAIGVFILWLGWFGFNPGSSGTIQGGSFAIIAITTNMAAAAGAISAMTLSWILFTKPDIGITLNGGLAGLVAITAGCHTVGITSAVIIGMMSGLLVVGGVLFLDKLGIDDPVGAVSVHGLNGAWGTLAVGLFADSTFGGGPNGLFFGGGFSLLLTQIIGVLVAFVWSFSLSYLVFFTMEKTIGLRVTEDEEIIGLDLLEHGNEAYPDYKS
ncbi:MAG TPA: ammonium transporter [Leptospiraceae bacterium]|nr:ammonium transporter [Leptospiraceae bacterium]HMX34731.1 ammonium transporter [Leptospiraceae bacterium]HMY30408.1 ammonium transporter [Leptospiraceae bacterium]HMZ64642.1 ammonium transporter [Leptospiraceae bacterium]HNA09381.1 ammonium transporter [Leptospiraceae bacterium]